MISNNMVSFILGAAFVFWLISPTPDAQEKTIYFKLCSDFKHNPYSCPTNLYVMQTRFKIFPKEQIVISDSPTNLTPCVVFDKDNWKCEDNEFLQSVQNGNYYSTNDGSLDEKGNKDILPRYMQISYLEYNIRSVIIFLRSMGFLRSDN